jgi:hypothetical protein
MGFSMGNGSLVSSQNGTQLTVAIKTLAGVDPSATDPVYVLFRNVTAATGDYIVLAITAATSIQTTVGGTFGITNSVPFRLWVVGFNDGGVFRLGLINCLSTVAGVGSGRDVTGIFPLTGWGLASSTLIGAGSTSSGIFYTVGAGVVSKAYATLGYLTYESGLATAGTFNVTQSRAQLFSKNDPLPGQPIQVQRTDTGAAATGTTVIPYGDGIPQITTGDQYMSQAITPTSAANALRVAAQAFISSSATGRLAVSLHQDAIANALKVSSDNAGTATVLSPRNLVHGMLAGATALTTFKLRAGNGSPGTTTFNGESGVRVWGGVCNSFLEVQEIMA